MTARPSPTIPLSRTTKHVMGGLDYSRIDAAARAINRRAMTAPVVVAAVRSSDELHSDSPILETA